MLETTVHGCGHGRIHLRSVLEWLEDGVAAVRGDADTRVHNLKLKQDLLGSGLRLGGRCKRRGPLLGTYGRRGLQRRVLGRGQASHTKSDRACVGVLDCI